MNRIVLALHASCPDNAALISPDPYKSLGMDFVRPSILQRPRHNGAARKNLESSEAEWEREQQRLERLKSQRYTTEKYLLGSMQRGEEVVGARHQEMSAAQQEMRRKAEIARIMSKQTPAPDPRTNGCSLDFRGDLDAKQRAENNRHYSQENLRLMKQREAERSAERMAERQHDRERLESDFSLRFGKSVR